MVKEKIIGLILIMVGILPFVINFSSDKITNQELINNIVPGTIIYQVVLIILGIVLVLMRAKKIKRFGGFRR